MRLFKNLYYIFPIILIFDIELHAQVIYPTASDSVYQRIKTNPMIINLKKLCIIQAIDEYPGFLRKDEFDVKNGLNHNRIHLYNLYPEYYPYKKRKWKYLPSKIAKEVTWDLNGLYEMTVWYLKDSAKCTPIYDEIVVKGTQF